MAGLRCVRSMLYRSDSAEDTEELGPNTSSGPLSWSQNLYGHWIGRHGIEPRPTRGAFIGQIDEVRISDTARYTGSTITVPQHMTADSDTVALWTFEEGTGPTAADSSPNGFDGTVVGATWVGSGRVVP